MQHPVTNPRNPKALGAFYTPTTIAELLAEWVVRSGAERILEPSVGEGALVAAVIGQARTVCGSDSHLRLFVCDIDPNAIAAILPALPHSSDGRAIDFLKLEPANTGPFHGVIANPPFTRNHALDRTVRTRLRERFAVSGAAGLWVHFLLHSLEFLTTGGRLAAVVPASALFTNYGHAALERICARFRAVEIHQIVDKPQWVNGADERGAIVLAEGYLQGSTGIPTAKPWSTVEGRFDSDAMSEPAHASHAFNRLASFAVPLQTLATLKIGAVTGYNAIFLMNEEERLAAGIHRADVVPIIGRVRQAPGLRVSVEDLVELASAGEKTWLLSPRKLGPRGSSVRRRLAKITSQRRKGTLWFTKRVPWWRVQLDAPCDAVFTYMNDCGPRIVLAAGDVRCTNTLHEVQFRQGVSHEQRIAASLSMISTFGQLAAERIGRSYGGGVLKFELAEARRMPILPAGAISLEDSFARVDQALRIGDRETARRLADEALLTPLLGRSVTETVSEMQLQLRRRRATRQRRNI